MAAFFKLDRVKDCRYRDGVGGQQLVRGVIAGGLSLAVAEPGYRIWLKALTLPGFPIPFSGLDADFPNVVLLYREFRGVEQHTQNILGELIYGLMPEGVGSGVIHYTLSDQHVESHVNTFCTADGNQNLYTWYKSGTSSSTIVEPAGAHHFHFSASKIITTRVFRAQGYATAAEWNAVKANIRAAQGTINSNNWGITGSRGTWLFLGPNTRTIDQGLHYYIELDFVQKAEGFYPLGFYYDILGRHPKDAATEADVRATGLPLANAIKWRNGIAIASIYKETPWPSIFNFTPD